MDGNSSINEVHVSMISSVLGLFCVPQLAHRSLVWRELWQYKRFLKYIYIPSNANDNKVIFWDNYLPTRPSFVSVRGSAVTFWTATNASLILVCNSLRSCTKSSFRTSVGCCMMLASVTAVSGWGLVFKILFSADRRTLGSGCGPIPAKVDTLSTPDLNAALETGNKLMTVWKTLQFYFHTTYGTIEVSKWINNILHLFNSFLKYGENLQSRLSRGFEETTLGVTCLVSSVLTFLYLSTENK